MTEMNLTCLCECGWFFFGRGNAWPCTHCCFLKSCSENEAALFGLRQPTVTERSIIQCQCSTHSSLSVSVSDSGWWWSGWPKPYNYPLPVPTPINQNPITGVWLSYRVHWPQQSARRLTFTVSSLGAFPSRPNRRGAEITYVLPPFIHSRRGIPQK